MDMSNKNHSVGAGSKTAQCDRLYDLLLLTTCRSRLPARAIEAINVREGLKPADFKMPGRTVGDPPLDAGPTANITVDVETMVNEYYQAMDWDPETGKPSRKKLMELGLEDVADQLQA